MIFLNLPDLRQHRQEARGVDDAGALVFSDRKQMAAVAGDKVVGVGGGDAFQDAIVGMAALDHFLQARRFNDRGGPWRHSEGW